MSDYAVLIEHLRECARIDPTDNTFLAAADAIEALIKPKWISVKDRLPTPKFAREWYLVALESGCVESLAFDRDRNCWWETGSPVTHWMLLPEPPKEE